MQVQEKRVPKTRTNFVLKDCSAILLLSCIMMGCGAGPIVASTPDPPVETVTITDRQVIEADGSYNAFASVERAANGDLVVAYKKGTGHVNAPLVILRRSSDGGASWSPEVAYFNTSVPDPTLAIMPNGRLLIEFAKQDPNGTYGSAYSLSSDNGLTWGAFTFFDSPVSDTFAFTSLFVTKESTLYGASYGPHDSMSSDPALWISADSGASWQKLSTIRQPGEDGANETSIALVGPSRFLAMSRDDLNLKTLGHFSDDLGQTWGPEIDYTSQVGVLQLPELLRTQKALLLFGRQYDANTKPTHEMVVFASYDGGVTFTDRTVLDTYTGFVIDGGYGWPLLQDDGSIFLVYYADSNNLRKPDIKSLVLHWGKSHTN